MFLVFDNKPRRVHLNGSVVRYTVSSLNECFFSLLFLYPIPRARAFLFPSHFNDCQGTYIFNVGVRSVRAVISPCTVASTRPERFGVLPKIPMHVCGHRSDRHGGEGGGAPLESTQQVAAVAPNRRRRCRPVHIVRTLEPVALPRRFINVSGFITFSPSCMISQA